MGTQYRSAIFTHTDAQRAAAEASRAMYQAELTKAGYGAITTEIVDAPEFYFAEDYHQQYLAKYPNGYCPIHATGVMFAGPIVADAAGLAASHPGRIGGTGWRCVPWSSTSSSAPTGCTPIRTAVSTTTTRPRTSTATPTGSPGSAGDIVMGRGMYEVMDYWDTLDVEDPATPDVERDFAECVAGDPQTRRHAGPAGTARQRRR